MGHKNDLSVGCLLQVGTSQTVRCQHVEKFALMITYIFGWPYFSQEGVHQQPSARRSHRRRVAVIFANDHVAQVWRIKRTEILNLDSGPVLNKSAQKLRFFQAGVLPQDWHFYQPLTGDCVSRHLISANAAHFPLLNKPPLWL